MLHWTTDPTNGNEYATLPDGTRLVLGATGQRHPYSYSLDVVGGDELCSGTRGYCRRFASSLAAGYSTNHARNNVSR